MNKYHLGQEFVDSMKRVFRITDRYASDREWIDERITFIFGLDNGKIHLQGLPNDAELRKVGFVELATDQHTVLNVEQIQDFEKRDLLRF